MSALGFFIAVAGIVITVFIIFSVLAFYLERFLNFWDIRWEWIRMRLVRKMIFRSKSSQLSRRELHRLNRDINYLNHIFERYRLDESYDKEEREVIRAIKKSNKGYN